MKKTAYLILIGILIISACRDPEHFLGSSAEEPTNDYWFVPGLEQDDTVDRYNFEFINNIGDMQADLFIREAATSHMKEIELAKMAKNRAVDQDVVQLAEMIQQDHQQALEELKPIAAKYESGEGTASGYTLITDTLHYGENEIKQNLQEIHGHLFDRAYVTMMIGSHKKSLNMYSLVAAYSDTLAIPTYAGNTAMLVRKHLRKALEIDKRFNADRVEVPEVVIH